MLTLTFCQLKNGGVQRHLDLLLLNNLKGRDYRVRKAGVGPSSEFSIRGERQPVRTHRAHSYLRSHLFPNSFKSENSESKLVFRVKRCFSKCCYCYLWNKT